ncbi:MAG: DUF2299 family protein [SAR324 cluster bacterium]|nr:DUF2299 family protein [SAR324 cluster bacterium]
MGERIERDQIETWLEDAGLSYEPHPLEKDSGYEWGILVSGQPFGVLVAQRPADYSFIYLQISVAVSESHLEVLRGLDEHARVSFVYDLRLALHAQPVGHVIEFEETEDGEPTNVPARVTLGTNLLEDPLVRAGFLRRNHLMQAAAHIVALMFKKVAHRGGWS